jgi:hypothetical protein
MTTATEEEVGYEDEVSAEWSKHPELDDPKALQRLCRRFEKMLGNVPDDAYIPVEYSDEWFAAARSGQFPKNNPVAPPVIAEGEKECEQKLAAICAENFLPTMTALAKEHMRRFFHGRDMHCGGKIQEHQLLTDRNVSLVMNTDVELGTQAAYRAMAEADYEVSDEEDSFVGDEVKLVIRIHHHCKRLGIPKENRAGITLLYLELCQGVDIEKGFGIYSG